MKNSLLLVMLLLCCVGVQAQQLRQLKGQVKDGAAGGGLPGVSIIVKGTTAGTSTDSEGNYSLRIPDRSDVSLTFSFIGYVSQTVNVGNQTTLDLALVSDQKSLDEVVVIGYATVARRDLTGSVSSVGAKQIRDIPVNSAADALNGRLAGVQITSSEGAPGADVRVRVRGGGSITQDNSPLYVVDGIQVENALSQISPQDIATIDVLKDAASTAIYGARGANGVVIITTKTGRQGKTVISYNGFTGFREISKKLDVLNPYDFVTYQWERTRGNATDSTSFARTYGSTWDTLSVYKNKPFVDWQDRIFGRQAVMQTHNISLTGGDQKTQYNLSLTSNKEDGIQLNSGFNRKLVTFKFDHKVNDALQAGVNVRYNNQVTTGAGTSTSGTQTTSRLRNAVVYRPYDSNMVSSLGDDVFDEAYFLASSLGSPVAVNNAEYRRNANDLINLNGYFSLKLANHLTFRSTAGVNSTADRNEAFNGTITQEARRYGNLPTAIINTRNIVTINNSNVLTYSLANFRQHHNLDVLLGQEIYQLRTRTLDIESRYLPSSISAEKALAGINQGVPPSGAAQPSPITSDVQSRILSFFGRVNYNYDDKYLLSLSLRADGSSKFAYENGTGYFPAASLAWRISNEKFMKNFTPVTDLKLRLSYGQAGNNRIGDFLYQNIFTANNVQYGLNETIVPGLASTALANPDLRWETTISRNIGLDFGVLNNRIQFTADYYVNTTKDLLVDLTIPTTSGYTSQLRNVGQTSNRGLELQMTATVINKRDFSWSTNFNLSFNKNRVDNLGGANSILASSNWSTDTGQDYIVQVGQAVGLMYGFETDGFYGVDDFTYNSERRTYTLKPGIAYDPAIFGATTQPGIIRFKDQGGRLDAAGNPLITFEDDRKVIGNANPKFTGGLNQQFTYKNFDMSVFVNFVYGNQIYNANKIEFTSGYYQNTNLLGIANDRWRTVNAQGVVVTDPTELKALNQNATLWQPIRGRYYFHSWAVEDGSFLRINNITLGYSLPTKLINKIKLTRARFYVTTNNLATLTKYTGFDPEVNTRRRTPLTPGVDYAAYPRSKAFLFGVNLSF